MAGRHYMLPPAGDKLVQQSCQKHGNLTFFLTDPVMVFICAKDSDGRVVGGQRSQSEHKVCPRGDASG